MNIPDNTRNNPNSSLPAEWAGSPSLLNAVLESISDGILILDQQGRVIHFNSQFAEMWRLPREALATSDHNRILELVLSQLKEGGTFQTGVPDLQGRPEVESRDTLHLKDGRVFDRHFRPHMQEGQCVGRVWSFRNVTACKQIEAGPVQEKDFLRVLIENIPDAIFFKDRESRFVLASRSTVELARKNLLIAYRAAHPSAPEGELPEHLTNSDKCAAYIIGKTDADFFSEERAHLAYADEQKIIQTGQAIVGQIKHTKEADGSINWRITTKMPWRDQGGKIIGTFGVSKDVTQIKEFESKLEKQLLTASRHAGLAEVATSVLHNVGNVLNSVNISVSLLNDRVRNSYVSKVTKVVDMLDQHKQDLATFLATDNRGEQVVAFLQQVAKQLVSEQTSALAELKQMTKNVDHIKEIVAMQQNYARISGVAEKIKPDDLVEDALRMHMGALARHDVKILREYAPDLPVITVEKHKVLQILVNLIHNAKYACDAANKPDKLLTIRVAQSEDKLTMAVIDNGMGISAENLPRIFQHGFTTRKEGHGFGLHSAALAANEIGGTLRVDSDGVGKGAAFTLEFPIQPKEEPQ